MKLLMLNGCVRGEESRTWKLARAFLKSMPPEPAIFYEQLDLDRMELRPLAGAFFAQRQQLLEQGDRDHPRFAWAHQFAEADIIMVAAPFWDMSIPAIVKLYIENVSVDGITFGCNAQGMYGMCRAKHFVCFTTRGDLYEGSDMEQGIPYLRAIGKMFGIPGFQYYYAEGLDSRPWESDRLLEQALVETERAGKAFFAALPCAAGKMGEEKR